MSFDLEAAKAHAAAIWTPENLAELNRRRLRSHYPKADDIAWLRHLGVYQVPRSPTAEEGAA